MAKKKTVTKVPPPKRPLRKIATTRKEGSPKIIPKPAFGGPNEKDAVG